MSLTNLSDCLTRNASQLGSNYDLLGSTIGTGFGKHKLLLSFNAKQGWKTVHLNTLQLLLRKIFGLYKSTHLETVFRAWKDLTKSTHYKNLSLHLRLKTLLHHPKRNFVVFGNASVETAEIFCFPEVHDDKKYRNATANFINEHYREGDVVLIEGQRAGVPGRNQQVERVKRHVQVFGWEPENFKSVAQTDTMRHHKEMVTKLKVPYEEIIKDINFENPDLSILESRLAPFIAKTQELATYFDPKGKRKHPNTQECVEKFFLMIKNKEISFEVFRALLILVLKELEDRQEEELYTHMKKKDVEFLLHGIQERNHCLCQEIQKYRAAGKRVFVIAGASHFLRRFFSHKKSDTEEIKSLLRQHHYVVLGNKEVMTRKACWLNRDLF
jgi:hypothetical protein